MFIVFCLFLNQRFLTSGYISFASHSLILGMIARLLPDLLLRLNHVIEDGFLVEFDRQGLTSGQVGEISGKSNHIRRVVLNVVVFVGTDHELVSVGVGAGRVQEAVLVDWVRQDVVVVDRSEKVSLAVGAFGKDQLLEVLFGHALHADTLTTHHFLLEPELAILVLQDREKWVEAFQHDQVLNSGFAIVCSATAALYGDEYLDEDPEDNVDYKGGRRGDLGEQLADLVSVQREQLLICYHRDHILEHLLIREDPGAADRVEDRGIAQGLQGVLAEATIVHGWLRVRVGHPESLTDVVKAETKQGNREENGHGRSVQEGYEDDIDDESDAVVDEEGGSRVECLELHNCFGTGLRNVARA